MDMQLAIECAVYVVFGIVLYFLDVPYGTKIKRAIYNQTHKDPLPENVEVGFLIGRTVRQRIPIAYIVSLLVTFLWWKSPVNAEIVPLLLRGLLVMPIGLSVGFFIAALIRRGGGVDRVATKVLDTMEKVEGGTIDPGEEVKDAVRRGTTTVVETATRVAHDLTDDLKDFATGKKAEKENTADGTDVRGVEASPAPTPEPEQSTTREPGDFEQKLRAFSRRSSK